MVFHPGKLREQDLDKVGYTILQVAGTLEYPNCRVVRMDYPWKCLGVTHEYWDGPTTGLTRDICWIEDQNDGGCKADKFVRDTRLLEKGLLDEPDNVRYMFYLAQTYHSLGRWKDAIDMYKKRYNAGGWDEERWYSLYMIAQSYLSLNDPVKFESWMLRARAFRPGRAEATYKLTKYFRESAEHYKAYHYAQLGKDVAVPSDSLFIEAPVYNGLFDYELSILEYYVHPEKTSGLRSSMNYLLKGHDQNLRHSVLSNLAFYAKPLGTIERLSLPSPFGPEYRPSAISIGEYPFANVRYVNYWIENGEYKTPSGQCVLTENAYVNLETFEVVAKMDDASVHLPRRDVRVKGLEDIRLYGGDRFTATVQEYADGVKVLEGRYNSAKGVYEDCKVLASPENRECEKNWLPVDGDILYDWFPLRVLGPRARVHATPPLFSMFRGSAPPVQRDDEWWTMVHMVQYSKPRKYYHCVVVLDKHYRPLRVSLPFVFRSPSIEYCVSIRMLSSALECYASFMDCDASRVTIPLEKFEWVSV